MTDKTIRRSGAISMLTTSERRPAIRTMRGWAIDVLQNAGAIRECEEHGWMQDRAEPSFTAEVEYRDITSEGLLRQSSFKGLTKR
jgi:ATP-dependent DNA ligase